METEDLPGTEVGTLPQLFRIMEIWNQNERLRMKDPEAFDIC